MASLYRGLKTKMCGNGAWGKAGTRMLEETKVVNDLATVTTVHFLD